MEIPQEVFNLYYETVDDFIDSNFGVTCTLYYPEKKVDCSNCIYDSLLKVSTNKYQSGGPIPFTTGICPYCNGMGYRSSVPTETVIMRIYYEKKFWIRSAIPINIADVAAQSYAHMVDFPKISNCVEAHFHSDIAGYGDFRYKLAGQPVPHGFKKNKYVIATWSLA